MVDSTFDPNLFGRWLLASGWTRRSSGRLGVMYGFGDSERAPRVAVPRTLPADADVARGLADRVAQAMEMKFADVWKRMEAPLTDRIELRVEGETIRDGRVPLGAASEALRNARKMISAAGTSVITPTRSIGYHYRFEAQAVARDAELAHTEDGSFVFPLLVSLGTDEVPTLPFDADSAIIEPYERRVTRTLATALSTTVDLTAYTPRDITEDVLETASSVGVTRELCVAISDLMKHDSVQNVQMNFDWSQAFSGTEAMPKSIDLQRETRPQVRSLAKLLAAPAEVDLQVYSGNIVHIGTDTPDDPQYFCVLDTYFRARRTMLRLNLSPEQHTRAIHWYEDRATVVVRGVATDAQPGLVMTSPDRIEAWSTDRL